MDQFEQSAINRCQQGDLSYFANLYDAYSQKIFQFVFFRTMHRQTAEDLTSQIFIKAMKHIGKYSSARGEFSTWLFQIARNTVIDYYRTAKKDVDIDSRWDLADKTDLSASADANRQLAQVRQYLNQLPPQHRDIIIMRLWDQLSYKQIAAITGKTESACKVAFSRQIGKLRHEMSLALGLILAIISQQ